MSQIYHQYAKADSSHMIHLTLPPNLGDEVEVFVLPREAQTATSAPNQVPTNLSEEQLARLRLQSGSGFAQNVLLDPAEEVWNEL